MKDTIRKFNNVRLEQEIANCYFEAEKQAPGIRLNEQKHPFLGPLWEEFDYRMENGEIAKDTDWESKSWREGYYE